MAWKPGPSQFRHHLWNFTRTRTLSTQARYDRASSQADLGHNQYTRPASLATPRQLVQYLDDFVVGQENAKKVLSVAVFNHYNRVRANLANLAEQQHSNWSEDPENDPHYGVSSAELYPHPYRLFHTPIPSQLRHSVPLFEKSNVLVIGPTGSGKTLLARTLANVLDVPFSVNDATTFTQAGYVGEDADMAIQRLLQAANWDPVRASTGIVYIDEIDKLARKSGAGTEGSRDVGGEGVQQALLRMMEGSVVSVQTRQSAAVMARGLNSKGEGRPRDGPPPPVPPASNPHKPDTVSIDTSNVLFILSGAFVGLDNVVKRRIAKSSIGFSSVPDEDKHAQGTLPFFTPNKRATSDVLELVEPSDLVKYGFIPEFISRLPSLTTLAPLTISDLRRILTEVRGSLISQYTALFGYSGVEIRFTSAALDEICKKAAARGGGARGLRGIMEKLLLEPMYEVPGSTIRHVLINDAVVRGEIPPLYWQNGQGAAFWMAWAEAEAMSQKSDQTTTP